MGYSALYREASSFPIPTATFLLPPGLAPIGMVHGHFRPENQVTRRHRKIARDFRCGMYVPCNSFTLRIFWKQPQSALFLSLCFSTSFSVDCFTFLIGFFSRRRLLVSEKFQGGTIWCAISSDTAEKKIRTCSRVALSFSVDKTILRPNRLQTPEPRVFHVTPPWA